MAFIITVLCDTKSRRIEKKMVAEMAKMSACLIIASYHNYLLFDFSMYVIRMFLSALEKCERSDVSFNMTRAPLIKHCCNMC